jgi:hypothetical protein
MSCIGIVPEFARAWVAILIIILSQTCSEILTPKPVFGQKNILLTDADTYYFIHIIQKAFLNFIFKG